MGRIEHGALSSSQVIVCLLLMSLGTQENHPIHTQHKTASVWEGWLQLVHLYYLNEALRQVIYNGAGWEAIQTSVLVMVVWIVTSMLVVWRAFRWL